MLDAPSIAPALQHRLLCAGEERRLLHRAADGDRAAAERLILHNLRLVASIAHRYAGGGVPVADLFQEGVLGLMRAIERFDLARKTQFSTYATWWIRSAMSNYQRSYRRYAPHALDPRMEDRTAPLPDEVAGARVRRLHAERLLDALPPRDGRVLRLRFGFDDDDVGRTYAEIGRELGCSSETVRLVLGRQLRALAGSLEARALNEAV